MQIGMITGTLFKDPQPLQGWDGPAAKLVIKDRRSRWNREKQLYEGKDFFLHAIAQGQAAEFILKNGKKDHSVYAQYSSSNAMREVNGKKVSVEEHWIRQLEWFGERKENDVRDYQVPSSNDFGGF